MTGRNLPPDTAREITGLKRRVTDLERVLDRVRRDTAAAPAAPWPAFTSVEGFGNSAAGAYESSSGLTHYHPANEIHQTVADPTGRLSIDLDTGIWRIRVAVAGIYEIGAAGTSFSTAAGLRHLAIQLLDSDGGLTHYRVATVPATVGSYTYLSGSRVVNAPAGSYWTASLGDDAGDDFGVEFTSLWARAVSVTEPVLATGA